MKIRALTLAALLSAFLFNGCTDSANVIPSDAAKVETSSASPSDTMTWPRSVEYMPEDTT